MAVKKKGNKYYLEIYDRHLSLAGNNFVMYRLIHISRSHYVFVTLIVDFK